MAIADRERELICIGILQALEARRLRLGERRVSEKKAAVSMPGFRLNKEMAVDNDNNQASEFSGRKDAQVW